MGRVCSLASTVASATVLAGCAVLTGVGDLRVDPLADDRGLDANAIDADATSASDVTRVPADAAGPSDGGSNDAITEGGDAGGRLREVTFEDGTLLGIHGGDSVFGNPFLGTGLSAIAGSDSMRADKGASGVQVDFAPSSELYATVLVRLQNTSSATGLVRFLPATGGVIAELRTPAGGGGAVGLVVGGNAVASGGNVNDSVIVRLGFHLRQDVSSSFVEVFLATGAAAFGAPIITATTAKLGDTAGARIGILDTSTSGINTKATFDNLLLDTRAMP